jgi:hypothetical protein
MAKPKKPTGQEPRDVDLTTPDKLTGSPKGYADLAEKTRFKGGMAANFMNDPEVRAAAAADKEIEQELEDKLESSVEEAEQSLEMLVELSEPEQGHDFANGVSIPFPYNGTPTTNYATCSRPMKEENRGCPVYWHCPLRDRGPHLLAYMDKRNKNQIRHITCVDFLKTGMVFMPHLVLLPGITWEGTITAEYTPFPDGSYPEPGPGKQKTPVLLKAVKSQLPPHLFPDKQLVVEYQRLRRHGEIRPFRQ